MHTTTYAPADPAWQGLFTFTLQDSVVSGFTKELGQPPHEITPERLDEWAESCSNPSGQKANLARTLAELMRCGHGLRRVAATTAPRGFWESV